MRDEITFVELSKNAGVDGKAATVMTAISVSNGAYIDVSAIDTDKLVIHVKNTYAAELDVTISAGDFSLSSLGALVVPVAASTGEQLIIVESARFKDSDGYLLIDFETNMTGLIGAYLLP